MMLVSNLDPVCANPKIADFTLKDINKKTVRLNKYLGEKVILINFWATWCKPCIREMVHLEKIFKEFKDKDFIILGIAVDSTATRSQVKPFVKANRYSYPMLMDTNSKVLKLYNPTATVPFSILVNKKGEIVISHKGYSDGDEKFIREEILKLINGEEIKTSENPEPVLRKEESKPDNDG
jgi:peroxiredoxin